MTLTNEDVEALEAYAAKHGRTWKSSLRIAWDRDDHEVVGTLRALRNSPGFGPQGLTKYQRQRPSEMTVQEEHVRELMAPDEPCGVCGSYVCGGCSAAQHTPGEWFFASDSYGKVRRSRKFDCVAAAFPRLGESERLVTVASRIENSADARLIAAAPELLAALRTLIAEPTWHRTLAPRERASLDAARAAIAKAEGRQP